VADDSQLRSTREEIKELQDNLLAQQQQSESRVRDLEEEVRNLKESNSLQGARSLEESSSLQGENKSKCLYGGGNGSILEPQRE
jgi:TolA-binding protein